MFCSVNSIFDKKLTFIHAAFSLLFHLTYRQCLETNLLTIKKSMPMHKKLFILLFCFALFLGCEKRGNTVSEVELVVSSELVMAIDAVSLL